VGQTGEIVHPVRTRLISIRSVALPAKLRVAVRDNVSYRTPE
jgi:hypothetical protein